MRELDRILGILLVLQSQRAASARQLAERFGVSSRTIYRDLRTMSLLGIPVYAERGRKGGVRLLEGYFLPPLMFSREEVTALLLGLLLLRSLRAVPFEAEADSASHKLLAALPEHLRALLAHLERILGIERRFTDIFHPEPDAPPEGVDRRGESAIVTRFLHALLDHRAIRLSYRSPYRAAPSDSVIQPLGLFWDRDRWYLVSASSEPTRRQRIWRADRVGEMTLVGRVDDASAQPSPSQAGSPAGDSSRSVRLQSAPPSFAASGPPGAQATAATAGAAPGDFDVRDVLGQTWLRTAMDAWRERAPVRLRVTAEQADRLRQDWYYRFARYDVEDDGNIIMTFGEADADQVLALVRWLGPGAQLLAPERWRVLLRTQLEAMLGQASS